MKYTLLYFSPTNETKKVNDYYKDNLEDYEVFNITDYYTRLNFSFKDIEFLISSFPIYSQGILDIVYNFLKKLRGSYAIINITYGGIDFGNGLYKAYQILKANKFKIIASSIISSKHSYVDIDYKQNLNILKPILDKIRNKDFSEINIKKQHHNVFANLFPKLRAKVGIKEPKVNRKKCIHCFECIKNCPVNAIKSNLKINKDCIRCTRCIKECPQQARTLKESLLMKYYLKRYAYKNIKNIVYY